MGRVRGTKRKSFGPLVVTASAVGFLGWRITSWGLRVGRWSWNARTGQHRVNLPGPWSWSSERTRRRPRRGGES